MGGVSAFKLLPINNTRKTDLNAGIDKNGDARTSDSGLEEVQRGIDKSEI